MHVRDIRATVPRVMGIAVGFGGFLGRRKRAAIALLVTGPPLLTGDSEVFALNEVGLCFEALLLRRFTRSRGRNQSTGAQQTAIARRTR